MKISKNTVNASTNTSKPGYSEAESHIQAAIDCLVPVSASNVVARDSIANLAVVLLDLSGDK